MSVRNNHARKESPCIYVKSDDTRYAVYSADWTVDKTKRRYVANKLRAGKLEAPKGAQVYYGITIVYATKDNTLVASEL